MKKYHFSKRLEFKIIFKKSPSSPCPLVNRCGVSWSDSPTDTVKVLAHFWTDGRDWGECERGYLNLLLQHPFITSQFYMLEAQTGSPGTKMKQLAELCFFLKTLGRIHLWTRVGCGPHLVPCSWGPLFSCWLSSRAVLSPRAFCQALCMATAAQNSNCASVLLHPICWSSLWSIFSTFPFFPPAGGSSLLLKLRWLIGPIQIIQDNVLMLRSWTFITLAKSLCREI